MKVKKLLIVLCIFILADAHAIYEPGVYAKHSLSVPVNNHIEYSHSYPIGKKSVLTIKSVKQKDGKLRASVSVDDLEIPPSVNEGSGSIDIFRVVIWQSGNSFVIGVFESHSGGGGSNWLNKYYQRMFYLSSIENSSPIELGKIYMGSEGRGYSSIANYTVNIGNPYRVNIHYENPDSKVLTTCPEQDKKLAVFELDFVGLRIKCIQ